MHPACPDVSDSQYRYLSRSGEDSIVNAVQAVRQVHTKIRIRCESASRPIYRQGRPFIRKLYVGWFAYAFQTDGQH